MRIETPAAYSFIMQDDIFLLNKDKAAFITPPAVIPVVETEKISFNYLGGHKKKFLVMAYYPGVEFMNEKHLAALESTFKRLDHALDDVAIVNLANYPGASFEAINEFFGPQKLLLLGKNAVPENFGHIPQHQIHPLNSGSALLTFSFDEMMDSNENKKLFWEQMKQL